jgi:hypothetical protein
MDISFYPAGAPQGTWYCGLCGALVLMADDVTDLHIAWHNRLEDRAALTFLQ